jgi:hypothetical protein
MKNSVYTCTISRQIQKEILENFFHLVPVIPFHFFPKSYHNRCSLIYTYSRVLSVNTQKVQKSYLIAGARYSFLTPGRIISADSCPSEASRRPLKN